jgi:hypothetical protein
MMMMMMMMMVIIVTALNTSLWPSFKILSNKRVVAVDDNASIHVDSVIISITTTATATSGYANAWRRKK